MNPYQIYQQADTNNCRKFYRCSDNGNAYDKKKFMCDQEDDKGPFEFTEIINNFPNMHNIYLPVKLQKLCFMKGKLVNTPLTTL